MGEEKITIEKICQFTLLDSNTILRLARNGYYPTAKKGIYDLVETLRGCFRYLKEERGKGREGKAPTASQALPTFNSMANCERATGTPSVVQSAAKKLGCEAFRGTQVDYGPLMHFLWKTLDGAMVAEWMLKPIQPELPSPVGNRKVGGRDALNEFKAQREQIRLQKDLDQVMSRDVIEKDIQEGMAVLFGTLDRVLINEMPPVLEGMRALEIRNKIQAELDSCKEQLRVRFTEMLKESTTRDSVDAPTAD